MSAIDQGHQADRVYAFARRIGLARLLVVKGKSSCPTILGVPWRAEALDTTGKRAAARRRRGLVLYPVRTGVAKAALYSAPRGTAGAGCPAARGLRVAPAGRRSRLQGALLGGARAETRRRPGGGELAACDTPERRARWRDLRTGRGPARRLGSVDGCGLRRAGGAPR